MFGNRLKLSKAELFNCIPHLFYISLPKLLSTAFVNGILIFILEKEAVSTWIAIAI